MKFIKEHTLMLLLSFIALGMCVLTIVTFCFIFGQQSTINAQIDQLENQRQEITALTATNSVLEREIADLKETYAGISVDLEKLEEFKSFQEQSLEELKNLLP